MCIGDGEIFTADGRIPSMWASLALSDRPKMRLGVLPKR